jgi:hypothetical protein
VLALLLSITRCIDGCCDQARAALLLLCDREISRFIISVFAEPARGAVLLRLFAGLLTLASPLPCAAQNLVSLVSIAPTPRPNSFGNMREGANANVIGVRVRF